MAAAGYTPISLYYSSTTTNTPLAANLVAGELAINTADGKLFYKDSSNVVQVIATKDSAAGTFTNLQVTNIKALDGTASASIANTTGYWTFSGTGAFITPKGTTLQQPASPVTGMLRYNTTTNEFEGYSGGTPAWRSVGGAAITNDTSTSSNLYPAFLNATSGTAATVYTSNAKLLYKPSTGELQSSALMAGNGFVVTSQTVATSYTIPSGSSAMSAGPITIGSGLTVTVPSGSRWVVV